MAVAMNGDDAFLVWNAGCQQNEGGDQLSYSSSNDSGRSWTPVESVPVDSNQSFPSQVVTTPTGFLTTADGYGFSIQTGDQTFVNSIGWLGTGPLLGNSSMGDFLYTGTNLVSLDRVGHPSLTLSVGGEPLDSIGMTQTANGELLIAGTYEYLSGVDSWSLHWPITDQIGNVSFLSQYGLGGVLLGGETQVIISPNGWSLLDGYGHCIGGCGPFYLWVLDSHPEPMDYVEFSEIGYLVLAAGAVFLLSSIVAYYNEASRGGSSALLHRRTPRIVTAKWWMDLPTPLLLDSGIVAYRRALFAWTLAWTPAAILIVIDPTSAFGSPVSLICYILPLCGLAYTFYQHLVARDRLARAISSPMFFESRPDPQSGEARKIRSEARASYTARCLSYFFGVLLIWVLLGDFGYPSDELLPNPFLIVLVGLFVGSRVVYHWELGRVTMNAASVADGQGTTDGQKVREACLLLGSTLLPINPAVTLSIGTYLYGSSSMTLFALEGLFPTLTGLFLLSWVWSQFKPIHPDPSQEAKPR